MADIGWKVVDMWGKATDKSQIVVDIFVQVVDLFPKVVNMWGFL
ncbi:hypothetical protein ABES03_02695 [Neobacillus rhizosphaerae]